jgi:hypothetical protein
MININDLELVEQDQNLQQAEDGSVSKNRSHKKAWILPVILVVTIGIIVVVVQPIYEAYLKAEIISEAISATRIKVERYAREHRSWPASVNDIKLNISERAKGEIDIEINNGIIELVISNISGKKARFSPSVNDRGYIVWECDHGGISQDYLPAMCFRGN